MEIMLIVVAGCIVFIIAILSVIKMVTDRVTGPTEDLKEEIATLKKRLDELENEKINE